ncbi:hydrolase [Glaciecola sp. MH2013]|uniref:hydrolase n=1 Tax=Glaciecola sp. MH2013 TaxID=2785524 RepID=UPI00189F2438|nr:hydrolase [Glaciecola sp. MH2013]MBF7074385.1 hydrolase [Glaciecola sp. MH2013]
MFKSEFGKVVKSAFCAPSWATNPHLQTIWPRYMVSKPKITVANERIATPDKDFIDIAWSIPRNDGFQASFADEKLNAKGVVVIFHGLEGSVNSHYAKHLIHKLSNDGYIVALMHFRGCSHEQNLTARAYHSGETDDPKQVLELVKARYPLLPIFAVGYSLGGNMLLKLLSEVKNQQIIKAAVAVSAPLLLAECSLRMQLGFSRLYQHYLLASMKNNLLEKMKKIDMKPLLSISKKEVKQLASFRDFDQKITAPLHGFESADDYYAKSSAFNMLKNINTRTLILHAKDDPFMTEAVVPSSKDLSPSVAYELSEKGGHVGFLYGSLWSPKLWLQQRISAFFSEQLRFAYAQMDDTACDNALQLETASAKGQVTSERSRA